MAYFREKLLDFIDSLPLEDDAKSNLTKLGISERVSDDGTTSTEDCQTKEDLPEN